MPVIQLPSQPNAKVKMFATVSVPDVATAELPVEFVISVRYGSDSGSDIELEIPLDGTRVDVALVSAIVGESGTVFLLGAYGGTETVVARIDVQCSVSNEDIPIETVDLIASADNINPKYEIPIEWI